MPFNYRFYYPPSIMGDEVLYGNLFQLKPNYYPKEKKEFDVTLEKLKTGEKVLEVGCGDGSFLRKLKENKINAAGLESNKLALQQCLAQGFDVRNESIEKFTHEYQEKFDAVVLFQVLENINEVVPFIENLLTCLKTNGKLIFAVPDNSLYHKNFRIHLT